MCVLGLPMALTPWQVEQTPVTGGTAVEWLKAAVAQEVVEVWQVSHWALVGMWLVGLPRAVAPLWQLEQRPAAGGLAVA